MTYPGIETEGPVGADEVDYRIPGMSPDQIRELQRKLKDVGTRVRLAGYLALCSYQEDDHEASTESEDSKFYALLIGQHFEALAFAADSEGWPDGMTSPDRIEQYRQELERAD